MGGMTLMDMSDKDLLYTLEEIGDQEGWATAREVAEAVNLDAKNRNQCIGGRFAWLKRFGIMDFKMEEGESKWRLNALGESLLHSAKSDSALKGIIAELSEAERIALTGMLAGQFAKDSRKKGRSTTHLARRSWKHSMDTWRDPSIAVQRA
jgi:hypothetical protein